VSEVQRGDETDRGWVDVNLANWNSRVPHHVVGYGLQKYVDDRALLSDVVHFDLPRLGDIAGLDVVHLQCHIATDTLSLARLGARSVTGLDFSQPAIDEATRFTRDAGADIRFVCAEVYRALHVLEPASFDLVYTGIGALCWLPSVRRWAEVVAALLRPGGRLFIREGHPMLWSLCEPRDDELVVVEFPYFEVPGGTHFVEEFTYVEHEGTIESPDTVAFNHGVGEIFNAVWGAGLEITGFDEHRTVPWNPLGTAMVEAEGLPGEYELRDQPERLAATYTLRARKL
jgi:SAM-dependent methyltransferase